MNQPVNQGSRFSYRAAERTALECLTFLEQDSKFRPKPGGALDRMFMSVIASQYLISGATGEQEAEAEQHERVTDLIALAELTVAVLRVRHRPGVEQIVEHVRRLDTLRKYGRVGSP